MYVPKRAILKARWQVSNVRENPVAELGPENYAAIYQKDIVGDVRDAEWQGKQPAFEHRLLEGPDALTYSGWLACHVMWPFEPRTKNASIVVPVWERDEDFRIVRVDAERLQVATAKIDFISPVEQYDDFIHLLANDAGVINGERPHSDLFM